MNQGILEPLERKELPDILDLWDTLASLEWKVLLLLQVTLDREEYQDILVESEHQDLVDIKDRTAHLDTLELVDILELDTQDIVEALVIQVIQELQEQPVLKDIQDTAEDQVQQELLDTQDIPVLMEQLQHQVIQEDRDTLESVDIVVFQEDQVIADILEWLVLRVTLVQWEPQDIVVTLELMVRLHLLVTLVFQDTLD